MKKAYDNVAVHDVITRASNEKNRIKRRLLKLDDDLLAALAVRLKELDSAVTHAREVIGVIEDVRGMRGRG